MDGRMMHVPLRVTPFLARAERYFGAREVVTRTAAGVHRTRWSEIGDRARRLASWLAQLGLEPFDRVATLAWNTHRHVELYYAVPGAELALHTLNLRLHRTARLDRAHADDRVIFVDDSSCRCSSPSRRSFPRARVRGDGRRPAAEDHASARFPLRGARGARRSELPLRRRRRERRGAALLHLRHDRQSEGRALQPRALAHASMLMARWTASGTAERDSILVAVPPLFHAAGWCIPYVGAMVGAKLVLPGPNLAPPTCSRRSRTAHHVLSGRSDLWSGVAGWPRVAGARSRRSDAADLCGSAVPAALIGASSGSASSCARPGA
jgi:fatty-acyl-CoA synthase